MMVDHAISSHIAVAIVSLYFGYWIGVGRYLFKQDGKDDPTSDLDDDKFDQEWESKGVQRDATKDDPTRVTNALQSQDGHVAGIQNISQKVDGPSESSSDDTGLDTIKAGPLEECKMVLVIRTDLGMTKGKVAAQCSHATLACYKHLAKNNPGLVKSWEKLGQAKITLKAENEEELLLLEAQAKSLHLCAKSIIDAGRTQIEPNTRTVLGIGPAPRKLIDQVTGHLRLY